MFYAPRDNDDPSEGQVLDHGIKKRSIIVWAAIIGAKAERKFRAFFGGSTEGISDPAKFKSCAAELLIAMVIRAVRTQVGSLSRFNRTKSLSSGCNWS